MAEEARKEQVEFDALVFSGGGAAAAAFIGALRAVEERTGRTDAGARVVVGASAGALLAVFVALGMSADEMEAWVLEHMLALAAPLRAAFGCAGESSCEASEWLADALLALPDRLGLDDGRALVRAVECAMRARGLRAPGDDWYDAGPTFADLAAFSAARGAPEAVVAAADVHGASTRAFSARDTPDVPVLLALRASTAVPVVFEPVRHAGRTYVDGAMFAYCPVALARAAGARKVLALATPLPEPGCLAHIDARVRAWLPPMVTHFAALVCAALTRCNALELQELQELQGVTRVLCISPADFVAAGTGAFDALALRRAVSGGHAAAAAALDGSQAPAAT